MVEHFAAALSAGDHSAAYALLSQGAVWSERDLFWRVAPTQPHAGERLRELIAADARIELEVGAVLGDETIVIVSERLWSDDVPDDLAPLRSTTLYLVEQGLVQGITRVLSAEQRDALFAEAMVGSWRCGAFTRFDADGTYGRYLSLEYLRSGRSYDSGTYAVDGGVITMVSGDDSEVCEAGQLIRFRWDVIDADSFAVAPARPTARTSRGSPTCRSHSGGFTRSDPRTNPRKPRRRRQRQRGAALATRREAPTRTIRTRHDAAPRPEPERHAQKGRRRTTSSAPSSSRHASVTTVSTTSACTCTKPASMSCPSTVTKPT